MIHPNKVIFFLTIFATSFLLAGCDSPQNKNTIDESFSVMSYNLRFDNPDDGENAWEQRKDHILNRIQFYEPAFVGTQEGLLHQLNYISDNITYYDWIGVGRDDGTMDGEFSALFYDTRRFELLKDSEQTFWLSNTPSDPSKGWDAALPRIVTLGEFRDKHTDKEFVVLNTHFDHVGDTARQESAKLIVNTIKKGFPDKPVILTGDFNATPDSKPYSILTEDSSPLRDAFNTSEIPNVGPSFTFEGFSVNSDADKRRIDYIFTNNLVEVKKHAIISSFNDFRYPSDHLPVITTLKISPQ